MSTTTTTYGLTKPDVSGSDGTWGTELNTTIDLLDDLLDGTTPLEGTELESSARIIDATDNTKKIGFAVSGITTSTTRTLTVPNASFTLVGEDVTQTLTNKTLTAPTLNGAPVIGDASAFRTALGLGTAATTASTAYATAAQGTTADAALPAADLASQAQAEAGTNNTQYMTPLRTQQAIDANATSPVKAWCVFNGTGTPAVIAGSNVASITDNGTGDYTVNFTNALASANYAVVLTSLNTGTAQRNTHYLNKTTGGFDINVRAASSALVDPDEISVTVLGA